MNRHFSVVSKFYSDGKIRAYLGHVLESNKTPKNSFVSTDSCDTYIDWFSSEEEALCSLNTLKEYGGAK